MLLIIFLNSIVVKNGRDLPLSTFAFRAAKMYVIVWKKSSVIFFGISPCDIGTKKRGAFASRTLKQACLFRCTTIANLGKVGRMHSLI